MPHEVSILGGAGYAGGELLRLLLGHPEVHVRQVASASHAGQPVGRIHPNLRGITELSFCNHEQIEACEVLFTCLGHGQTMSRIDELQRIAPRIVDLSADFRLRNPADYGRWYDTVHPCPERLAGAVYGLAELHREGLRSASLVACAGCNATATILALAPLYRAGVVAPGRTVVEVKVGSSEGGRQPSQASHHPERAGAIRCYRPTTHRHVAEIRQELELAEDDRIHFTATALDMVRGIHCVAHVFTTREVDDRELWRIYRAAYGGEPFIRLINERRGIHRLPDPRRVTGTHFCDIGFVNDPDGGRVVVLSAIDNLVRGAAGQAVHAFNLMHDLPEETGLGFPGLHPL